MKSKFSLLVFGLIIFITCSDETTDPQKDAIENEVPAYYGTYLYSDHDCGGADIQYATMDENGISFFDFLGDNCDDTAPCYAVETYELTEISQDTMLIVSEDGSSITNAELYLDGDSALTLTYEGNNGIVSYAWEKIKDEIYSFTPVCDQEYGSTKDIADMMVYAVSDNGTLLWKNYIHGGIWDLGSAVAPVQDGGYMVFGIFDGIEWGGCCYTFDYGVRDLIKLDSEGQIVWKKEIQISDDGLYDHYFNIGSSLFETSQGDLVFLAPGAPGNNNLIIVMIDSNGDIIWRKNYSDADNIAYHSGNVEIIEADDGNLALVGGWITASLTLIDYTSGNIILSSDLPCGNARRIINTDGGFAMVGIGESDNVAAMKVDDQGAVIWSQLYDDPSTMGPLDIINQDDGGYLIFCYSDPPPYATLIKTDSLGNELWRKKYDDYIGGGKGWIHQTDDGGYFMASGYAVTKLNMQGHVQWNAAAPTGFLKNFNGGSVCGINHDMKRIDGGAVMVGYGSADWE